MTDKPTLPENLAAAAGMPTGSDGHSLHPDPAGHADPIGVRAAAPDDLSLRPDPAGLHDPRPHAAEAAQAAAAVEAGVRATGERAADLAGRVREHADQARERASGLADDIQSRLGGAADEARARAATAFSGARSQIGDFHERNMRRIDDLSAQGIDGLNRGRGAVERFVDENPLLVGVVGVAAGLLLGALLPRTRQEDRNLGPWADEVRDQGLRYAREVTSKGREFVQTALDPDNINAAARKAADADTPAPPASERAAHTL